MSPRRRPRPTAPVARPARARRHAAAPPEPAVPATAATMAARPAAAAPPAAARLRRSASWSRTQCRHKGRRIEHTSRSSRGTRLRS
eukprot:4311554-Prymnesium_polylepis.1